MGAYLFGAGLAVVASILSERALFLACPAKDPREDGSGSNATKSAEEFESTRREYMGKYLHGLGYNWSAIDQLPAHLNLSAPLLLPTNAPGYDRFDSNVSVGTLLSIPRWLVRRRWPHPFHYNRTHVQGLLVPEHAAAVVIHASEFDPPGKLLVGGAARENFRRFVGLVGWEHGALPRTLWDKGSIPRSPRSSELNAFQTSVARCAYHSLLQPSDWLRRLVLDVLSTAPPGRKMHRAGQTSKEERRIPAYVALHVRLGDAHMVARSSNGTSSHAWQFAAHEQVNQYRSDPDRALGCFASLNRSLPHVVVSDSSEVVSRAAAHGMLTSRGLGEHAIHLGMERAPSLRNVDRLFADFWLLTAAADAYTFTRERFIAAARLRAGRPARLINNVSLCLSFPELIL